MRMLRQKGKDHGLLGQGILIYFCGQDRRDLFIPQIKRAADMRYKKRRVGQPFFVESD